jgi:hypothetical protein
MGEDFEGPAMKMIDFAKKQTEREAAGGDSASGGNTIITDASVKTNNTNTGQSNNGPINPHVYRGFNISQEIRGMGY